MTKLVTHSSSWEGATPFLSVLIPFYRDDASTLFQDLEAQAKDLPIEVLLQDDGTGDSQLTSQMKSLIESSSVAARLYTCLLYTSPSPRDLSTSRMPSSA